MFFHKSYLKFGVQDGHPVFKALPDNIGRNEAAWKRFYEANEPDSQPGELLPIMQFFVQPVLKMSATSVVPDYNSLFIDNKDTGAWLRLLLVRSLRMDRTLLVSCAPTNVKCFLLIFRSRLEQVVRDFIRGTAAMGDKYVEPVTDTIDSITEEMTGGARFLVRD
jgi:dynein heavy chain